MSRPAVLSVVAGIFHICWVDAVFVEAGFKFALEPVENLENFDALLGFEEAVWSVASEGLDERFNLDIDARPDCTGQICPGGGVA